MSSQNNSKTVDGEAKNDTMLEKIGVVATAMKTTDAFLNSLPANASLQQFTNTLEKDKGMRTMVSDMDEQVAALRKFEKGEMTYAEMRALCG
jgi:hypothetical protein